MSELTSISEQVQDFFSHVLVEYATFQGWDGESDLFTFVDTPKVDDEPGFVKDVAYLSLGRTNFVFTLADVADAAKGIDTGQVLRLCQNFVTIVPEFLIQNGSTYILASLHKGETSYFTVDMLKGVLAQASEEPPEGEEDNGEEAPTTEESEKLDSQEDKSEV